MCFRYVRKVLKISMYAMVYFLLQYHIYEHLQTRTWQKFKFLRQSKTQIKYKSDLERY